MWQAKGATPVAEPERWEVSTDAAEVYESCFVPAIFGAWVGPDSPDIDSQNHGRLSSLSPAATAQIAYTGRDAEIPHCLDHLSRTAGPTSGATERVVSILGPTCSAAARAHSP
jgi:hypothetical protein